MTAKAQSNRLAQLIAWPVASLFLLGFFLPLIGTWTGPILGVWFVGTQKLRRGFVWMLAINYLPDVLMDWRRLALNGPAHAIQFLGSTLLFAVLGILPFTFHRLLSPRLTGLLSTLPLPLAVVVFRGLLRPQLHEAAVSAAGVTTFLIFWFAAVVVWMWNQEFRRSSIDAGAAIFAVVNLVAAVFLLFTRFSGKTLLPPPHSGMAFAWICLGGCAALSVWALLHPGKRRVWAERPATVSLLQSPETGTPLHVVAEGREETLASDSGEQFPIRDGIPDFRRPQDLTGDNGKYNHLYETIGGFYDDTQRVACALKGVDRDEYFLAYMRMLEAKPGDSVLETSVGTGLSFRYLPRGVKLFGLDLSQEMLANCQVTLRRWEMEADLFLGNAESLPFADSSFDAVFHVGGISFFNDQAKAIREMIRVAKPGTLLLISDETEEYAQKTYERIPITSSYYKNRKTAVTIPIDLVPADMEDIHLEMIKGGLFYAITFRKPASV